MIRSIYKYVCAALIATAALTACSDEVSLDDNWQPSLSPHQVEFSVSDLTPFEHSGGSQTLTVTSTIDWTIVDKPDFVTITPASGATGTTTITVKASPNTGGEPRSGEITFGDASAKVFRKKVQVEQGYHQVEFSVSDLTPFEHTGGSQTLTVMSNIEWTIVDKPDFVTITPVNGAAGTTTITVTASPYDGIGLRSGDITFGDASAKVFRKKVQVEQEDAIPRMTVVVGGVTFNMIKVEHGTFEMGSTSGFDGEKPVHSVTISKDYYLGETEVTQALWKAVTGQSPTSGGTPWASIYGLGDNYPAYYISYEDVQSFITKLNQMTGQQFRMPTEAEWEYAAKGGNKSKGYTYSGSNTIGDVAWYSGNSGSKTHPVKMKAPNELGIYDMTGNVYEWCSDRYGSYSSSAVTDPTGPSSGSYRVYRSGCWSNSDAYCRTAYRNHDTPSRINPYIGFRLAL